MGGVSEVIAASSEEVYAGGTRPVCTIRSALRRLSRARELRNRRFGVRNVRAGAGMQARRQGAAVWEERGSPVMAEERSARNPSSWPVAAGASPGGRASPAGGVLVRERGQRAGRDCDHDARIARRKTTSMPS